MKNFLNAILAVSLLGCVIGLVLMRPWKTPIRSATILVSPYPNSRLPPGRYVVGSADAAILLESLRRDYLLTASGLWVAGVVLTVQYADGSTEEFRIDGGLSYWRGPGYDQPVAAAFETDLKRIIARTPPTSLPSAR